MDTNRLSDEMLSILNEQVKNEAQAAQIFLSYGAWADDEGYGGVANFLFRHSQEERNHMMKYMEYIMQRGGKVEITALEAPPEDPGDMQDCLEKIYEHEVNNTEAIYRITNLALEEKDWATWNFNQWFIEEQIEEETMVMDLLDKLKIAGGPKASNESLFYFDNQLASMPDEADLARDATVEDQ